MFVINNKIVTRVQYIFSGAKNAYTKVFDQYLVCEDKKKILQLFDHCKVNASAEGVKDLAVQFSNIILVTPEKSSAADILYQVPISW